MPIDEPSSHTCSNLQYHYYFYIAFSPETLGSTSPATDSTVSARDMITSPARDRSTSPIRSYESGALSVRIAMTSPAKDAGREAEVGTLLQLETKLQVGERTCNNLYLYSSTFIVVSLH